MSIVYFTGDATRPKLCDGDRFIIHVCNVKGGWGRGFAAAVSRRWARPEAYYRDWHRTGRDTLGGPFELGNIQPIKVEGDERIIVVNMLAQKFIGAPGPTDAQDEIPLSYDALAICLTRVRALTRSHFRRDNPVSIHGPKLGSGLAGGDWGSGLQAHRTHPGRVPGLHLHAGDNMNTCEKCGDETGRCRVGENKDECGWEAMARTHWEEMCKMWPPMSTPVKWESIQGPRKPMEIKAMRLTLEKHHRMASLIVAPRKEGLPP